MGPNDFEVISAMHIREATESDLVFIQRLLVQLGYPDFNERDVLAKLESYRRDGYRLLVAESDHETVAFIALHWFEVFHFPGRIGRITAFCVDEQFRGEGIGTQLMEAAEKLFRTNDCTKLEVTSNQRRQATHQFYLKRGYVEDSRRFVKYLK